MRIVGIDPGATTGLSLVIDGEVIEDQEAELSSLLLLWNQLHDIEPEVIIAEDFLGHRSFGIAGAMKALGVCELYAEMMGAKIVRSNPSALQGKARPSHLSPHIWSARVHALNGYKRRRIKNASSPK